MSTITKEELALVQADPISAVTLMLDKLEEANGDVMVVDPSNPFSFIMEAIAINASVLREEINTKHYRTYPMLANDESSLYNNMNYIDYKNIFAQPSDSIIRFVINVTNFMSSAIVSPTGEYRMVSIPEGTTISVEGYDFLVANRIDIKRFTNDLFSIEQNTSTTSIGATSLGILPYAEVTSGDENRHIVFDTILKQLSLTSYEYTINQSDSISKVIDLNNKLHYITASITSAGVTTPVEVSYSEIIDPTISTIIVKKLSDSIEVTVPEAYILTGAMVGKLKIDVYTTRGEVDYPLNEISASQYVITYNNINTDNYTSVIGNVGITANGIERLTGGSNGKSLEEIRNSIINNTVGSSDVPITKEQLLDALSRDGFYGYLLKDTVTSRVYIASRTVTPTISNNLENANSDVFIYKTQVVPSNYTDHSFVLPTFDSEDRLVIKPNTFFKEVAEGVIPLSMDEINALNNMTVNQKISYLGDNSILYTPYSYISSIEDGVYYIRSVNFESSITGNTINTINSSVLGRINISTYSIVETQQGYTITFNMLTNSEFSNIDMSTVKSQLRISINEQHDILYQADFIDNKFVFNIDTDFYVSRTNRLNITNGTSELFSKEIELALTAELSTYVIVAPTEITEDLLLNTGINSIENVVVYTTENVDITFGTILDNLYSNMVVSYTDRKYVKYEEDIYATYDDNIYATNSVGTLLTPNGDSTEVTYNLLHRKGDRIVDEITGEEIIIHSAGDTILDENGNPIIDVRNGIIKYIDILLLEYSSLFNETQTKALQSNIKSYLQDIKEYSDSILEETDIIFKPFRTNDGVQITLNNSYKTVYDRLKPEVTLYVEDDITLSNDELIRIRNTVGSIIHSYINKETFYITDIKEDIKNIIDINTVAVGLKLDVNDEYLKDTEKIALYDNTNRLTLARYLVSSLTGVKLVYDIQITIRKT